MYIYQNIILHADTFKLITVHKFPNFCHNEQFLEKSRLYVSKWDFLDG